MSIEHEAAKPTDNSDQINESQAMSPAIEYRALQDTYSPSNVQLLRGLEQSQGGRNSTNLTGAESEQAIANNKGTDTAQLALPSVSFSNGDGSQAAAETREQKGDARERTVNRGGSEIVVDNDGKIDRMRLPNGARIERQGDKYVGFSPSSKTADPIDEVLVDRNDNDNIKIKWSRTKAGLDETTTIRVTGTESVFTPPKGTALSYSRLDGKPLPEKISGVRSMEVTPGKDGGLNYAIRTENHGVYRVQFDKAKNLTAYTKLDSPSQLKAKDLPKAAGEVARLIEKNNGHFGNDLDRRYIAEVYKQYNALNSLDFDSHINDALKTDGKRSRYEIAVHSIRNSTDDELHLLDRSRGGRSVSSIVVPKGK